MAKASTFDFQVQGNGPFPFDMLRFDECWPVTSADANAMDSESSHMRIVRLRTSNPFAPTAKRWESFTWKVVVTDFDAADHS